jgi:ankyrin repeat protein
MTQIQKFFFLFNGNSCLMIALRAARKDVFTYLMKAKADAKYINPQGEDALMVAVEAEQEYAIPVLVKAGASV